MRSHAERQRREFRAMVLRQRFRCEARLPGLCMLMASEVNELQRGPARQDCWLDWNRVAALCSPCHAWLTNHPDWAYRHGHQLPHEAELSDDDWEQAYKLRQRFVFTPCSPNCQIDHRVAGPDAAVSDDRL